MIFDDLKQRKKQALKNKEKLILSTINTIISDSSKETKYPSDEVVLKTIKKHMENVKETKQARENFGMDVSSQDQEIDFLNSLLPEQMSDNEIKQAAQKAIDNVGASSMKDMGRVMSELKNYGPKMDMAKANQYVKSILS